MTENRKDQVVETKPSSKQAYTTPELVKHGNVETLTQLVTGPSTSQPFPR